MCSSSPSTLCSWLINGQRPCDRACHSQVAPVDPSRSFVVIQSTEVVVHLKEKVLEKLGQSAFILSLFSHQAGALRGGDATIAVWRGSRSCRMGLRYARRIFKAHLNRGTQTFTSSPQSFGLGSDVHNRAAKTSHLLTKTCLWLMVLLRSLEVTAFSCEV